MSVKINSLSCSVFYCFIHFQQLLFIGQHLGSENMRIIMGYLLPLRLRGSSVEETEMQTTKVTLVIEQAK